MTVRPSTVSPSEARVVVDDVELVPQLEKRQQMLELPVALRRCARSARHRRRTRGRASCRRIAGGEEGDVDSRVDEAVGQELDDRLDSAVAIGGNGEPDRAEERDAHYVSSTSMVPFLTSTDHTRPTARTPSSRVPSSQFGARVARGRKDSGGGIRPQAEQQRETEHGRPGRPRLGPGRSWVGDGKRRLARARNPRRPPARSSRGRPPPRSG